jgi:hypothetical protein
MLYIYLLQSPIKHLLLTSHHRSHFHHSSSYNVCQFQFVQRDHRSKLPPLHHSFTGIERARTFDSPVSHGHRRQKHRQRERNLHGHATKLPQESCCLGAEKKRAMTSFLTNPPKYPSQPAMSRLGSTTTTSNHHKNHTQKSQRPAPLTRRTTPTSGSTARLSKLSSGTGLLPSSKRKEKPDEEKLDMATGFLPFW